MGLNVTERSSQFFGTEWIQTTCLPLASMLSSGDKPNVHLEGDSDRYTIPELCHDGHISYPLYQGL
jgi:hypothetical protein